MDDVAIFLNLIDSLEVSGAFQMWLQTAKDDWAEKEAT